MNKLWVTHYVNEHNYKKFKWILIALVVGLTIIFGISLYFAIKFNIELNSFTTITLSS